MSALPEIAEAVLYQVTTKAASALNAVAPATPSEVNIRKWID